MNTSILMAAEGKPEDVETGFSQAEAVIHGYEQRFTRFSQDSELSHLNQAAGNWFQASKELYEVVALALDFHQQTGGLFDPGILPALQYAGYDRSMDEIQSQGDLPAPKTAVPQPQKFSETVLNPEERQIYLPRGLSIDLGGIAKGWIAEQAAQVLAQYSTACAIDAGGDASLLGSPSNTKTWRIALENPCDSNQALAILKLGPGAVATSAITRRRWQQDGKQKHHLIDPRTQRPADTEWNSVTVIAPHATAAEVYAKSILIGGPVSITDLTRSSSEIEYIIVDQQNKLWGSKHSREFIDEQN